MPLDLDLLGDTLGIGGVLVSNGVGDTQHGVDVQRCVKGRGALVEREDAANFRHRLVQQPRHRFQRRLGFARIDTQPTQDLQHGVELLDHMHRQANGARLVHDGALDVLANPPGRIGGKAETALGIEFFQRVDQAEIAFLDQVVEQNAAMLIMLGDADHQAQVGLDHVLARGKIALLDGARQRQFLRRRQERRGADFPEIKLGDVIEKTLFARHVVSRIVDAFRLPGQWRAITGIFVIFWNDHQRAGRNLSGSTGLPCWRTSKCSLGWSASELPSSAIFWPRVTVCPSLTRMRLLWA